MLWTAAALVLWTVPVAAHAPATVRVASPKEGARVPGPTVRVVLVGEGGLDAAQFRLDLDGNAVDATGKVGGLFSSLSVRPNQQLVLDVPVGPGDHTLTLTTNPDPDAEQQVTVRRFSVGPDEGNGAMALVLAGLAVAGGVGAAVVVRRKAAPAHPRATTRS